MTAAPVHRIHHSTPYFLPIPAKKRMGLVNPWAGEQFMSS
jgi:hypothetical protein